MNPCLLYMGHPPLPSFASPSIIYPHERTHLDNEPHGKCVAIRLGASPYRVISNLFANEGSGGPPYYGIEGVEA